MEYNFGFKGTLKSHSGYIQLAFRLKVVCWHGAQLDFTYNTGYIFEILYKVWYPGDIGLALKLLWVNYSVYIEVTFMSRSIQIKIKI